MHNGGIMINTLYKTIGFLSAIIGIVWFLWAVYYRNFPYKKLSWKFAERKIQEISDSLIKDNFSPTLIIGIGRGGAIVGSMISGCLGHRPLLVIDREYKWKIEGREEDMLFSVNIPQSYLRKVLLVSGEIHSGRTMKIYYDYLISIGAARIKKAVLFFEKGCPLTVDYIGIVSSKKNVLMPWMFSQNYIRGDRFPPEPRIREKTMLALYLIRHGRTTYDDNDRFCGISNPNLSETGIEQSISIGKFFRDKNIEIIYTSSLKRAVETGKIIHALNPGSILEINPNLNEINFGAWEGLTRKEIKERFSKEYRKWEKDPYNNPPPDGENPSIILQRMLQFLQSIEDKYDAGKDRYMICITHKTPIRLLLSYFEHSHNISAYRQYKIDNGEIVKLMYNGTEWQIERHEEQRT